MTRSSLLLLRTVGTWFLLVGIVCGGSARGQTDKLNDLLGQGRLLGGASSSPSKKLKIDVRLTAPQLAPGETATLAVSVTLPPGYYIYSTDRSFGGATKIAVDEAAGLEPLDEAFVSDHPPKRVFEPLLEQKVEKFYDRVTWTRRYRIGPETDPADVSLSGSLTGQYCSAGPSGQCIPIRPPYEFDVALSEGHPASGRPGTPVSEGSLVAEPFTAETTPERRGRPGPGRVRFELAPPDAKPGETVTLRIALQLDEDWHVYSITQKPGNAAEATSIDLLETYGLKPVGIGFRPEPEPEAKRIDVSGQTLVQEVHHGRVTWSRTFEVAAEAKSYGVRGTLRYQTCDANRCLPPWTVPFALGTSSPSTAHPVVETAPPPASSGGPEASSKSQAGLAQLTDQGLLAFLLTAVVAGFAALLTPCVFPMIPITVSFFLKQSEKEHHRPVWMASIYCVGIIVAFTVLGLLMAALFGATKMNEVANNPWLNLALAGLLVFFGLNLLGMFEIRVPGWLVTWTAGKENRGGVLGVLFMALTFTLVSFTCTFAFAGLLLALAAGGDYYWPILGMVAFSAAFSLPFFFLALFPAFLRKLPKSGGWMNTVKVTMGMIEVGAAVKFFSVADLAWNPAPLVFDYSLVLTSWMVIAGCTGLYLLGLFRLPHDTPSETISVPRLAFAVLFLGLAGYLSVGLFAMEKPRGKLWQNIAAFAPLTVEGGEASFGPYIQHEGGDLRYALDFEQALDYAQAQHQPLFLDFTGVNCVNCRKMEGRMRAPENRQRLEKFVRVQLYTDNVPQLHDSQQVERLLRLNRRLQEQWFGDVTLPSYAIITPERNVLATYIGMERRSGEFTEFLDQGLAKWGRLVQRKPAGQGRLAAAAMP